MLGDVDRSIGIELGVGPRSGAGAIESGVGLENGRGCGARLTGRGPPPPYGELGVCGPVASGTRGGPGTYIAESSGSCSRTERRAARSAMYPHAQSPHS